MSAREGARSLLERLEADGHPMVEVFVKRGRTRRSELGPQGPVSVLTDEAGWAVRAGGVAGSFFCCGSGSPPLDAEWPRPRGEPLRLPEAGHPGQGEHRRGEPAANRAAPLMVESEARGLVDSLGRELGVRLEGARVLRAVLEDGASEAELINSRGIDCAFGSRLATLHVEAVRSGRPETRMTLEVTARGAQHLEPRAVVQRLADGLAVRGPAGEAPVRERGEMVLAPAVGARLLAALMPLWLGPEAARRAAALTDRHDRLASPELSIVDDGRLTGGAFASPVDGEGVPTRRFMLVEKGRYVQPLVDWRAAESRTWRPTGCTRRPSWRDFPRPGISHLHAVPVPEIAPGELVRAVARGFYLLDAVGAVRVDLEADRFAVEVCGFSLAQGTAQRSIGRAWLCGGVGALLRGVRAAARDLAFIPAGGMVGAPTLLVAGLELRREI